ncbi:MAG: SCO family protein, partial [Candidatus Binatia bacterium]
MSLRRALAAAAIVLAATSFAHAARPKALEKVGFDQKLDAVVPTDVRLRDETGREIRLADALAGKPAILDFAYFRCPMLCPVSLWGLAASLKTLSWSAGEEFRVVTVSIDPADTPAAATETKRKHLDHYGRAGAESGWRFLVGDEGEVRRLADAVGFRFARDERTGEYAHAAGVVFLTPEARVSRYLYGVEPTPRDLRLALVEAADGKIGGLTEQLLLLCFH